MESKPVPLICTAVLVFAGPVPGFMLVAVNVTVLGVPGEVGELLLKPVDGVPPAQPARIIKEEAKKSDGRK